MGWANRYVVACTSYMAVREPPNEGSLAEACNLNLGLEGTDMRFTS